MADGRSAFNSYHHQDTIINVSPAFPKKHNNLIMESNTHNNNILNQVGRSTDFSDQTPNSSSGTTAPAETVGDENEDEDDAKGNMFILKTYR